MTDGGELDATGLLPLMRLFRARGRAIRPAMAVQGQRAVAIHDVATARDVGRVDADVIDLRELVVHDVTGSKVRA